MWRQGGGDWGRGRGRTCMESEGEARDINKGSPDRVANKNLNFLAKLILFNPDFF